MATERIMSRSSSSSCSDAGSLQEELDNGKKMMEKLPMENSINKTISTNILNNKNHVNRGSVDDVSENNSKNKSKDAGLKKKLKSAKKIGRRDPERFLGDGVNFKAKLIGSHDVPQARGEMMAQEALQDLKVQKKLSGEHKRKIVINISLDGLRIREEKKKEVLYFHAVHKISFISQDATDNRSFGYIYGSPDNVHTFFAIKTEKLAHQIVMCMRDLFQIAFELKKKEIEQWRQQQLSADNKTNHAQSTSLGTDSNDGSTVSSSSRQDTSSPTSMDSSNLNGQFNSPFGDEGNLLADFSVSDNQNQRINIKLLPLDLETLAPNVDNFFTDPWEYMRSHSTSEDIFEDSSDPFGLELESSNKPLDHSSITPVDDPFNTNFVHVPFVVTPSSPCIPIPMQSTPIRSEEMSSSFVDKYAALADISLPVILPATTEVKDDVEASFDELVTRNSLSQEFNNVHENNFRPDASVIFSELDPLGKDRPYVDKKDFFYDVKNPPKKVLNDLKPKNSFPTLDFSATATMEDNSGTDEVEITSPPSTLPPPLPPPFIRRPRIASPIFNTPTAQDGADIVPRPNSRSSFSTSVSSSLTTPEVYLPPPPLPPPRSQLSVHVNNITSDFSSAMNNNGYRDSVYSSSGSSDGSSSPTGDGPITQCNSSSLVNSTSPIPIPSRRGFPLPLTPSSMSSSGISSAHNSGSFDHNNIIERPCSKWNMSTSNPISPTTILSPPPSNNARKSNLISQFSWLSENNIEESSNRHADMQKANIFRKEEDPFNDDEFFSALRINNNSNPFR